jgi:hypothetical protein
MPPKPTPKKPVKSAPPPVEPASPAATPVSRRTAVPSPITPADLPVSIAVSSDSGTGTVTARKAGGLLDLALQVDPDAIGVKGALQHMAKAVNIAFQTDYGENHLESVYQAAVVRNGRLVIVHKEYFGFGDNWFGQFGRLVRSLQLTLQGPDPASPEGRKRFQEEGPATVRGILNLIGRKVDIVAEFEDRVPAYVEQMFDRLEASGIITGWDRDDWDITTTSVGLDILISPKVK